MRAIRSFRRERFVTGQQQRPPKALAYQYESHRSIPAMTVFAQAQAFRHFLVSKFFASCADGLASSPRNWRRKSTAWTMPRCLPSGTRCLISARLLRHKSGLPGAKRRHECKQWGDARELDEPRAGSLAMNGNCRTGHAQECCLAGIWHVSK